jgi:ADP-heptose:LPS heptosyltransferase
MTFNSADASEIFGEPLKGPSGLRSTTLLNKSQRQTPRQIAQEILNQCLKGAPPADLPRELLEEPDGQALFGVLAEGLADRFELALCGVYAGLFARAVSQAMNGWNPAALTARYEQVRRVRPIAGEPRRIFVLSRVTLGADVAVSSVLLDAAKRRFPRAEIVLVGPAKNYELFAGDGRVRHAPLDYRRGSLRDRLAVLPELKALLGEPDSAVIDPDSRLTQLGLLPVCPEERHYLFESRAYGGESDRCLAQLTADWAAETFGISNARPYIALPQRHQAEGHIAVSLGVGENPAKRVPDPFEEELLSLLGATGGPIWIDQGAGGEEAARVERAVARSGVRVKRWDGSFAGFAAIIAASRMYVGYDSAGQHVASAAGVPLISIFAGFPSSRMFHRWKPEGNGARVIRVDRPDPKATLEQVRRELSGFISASPCVITQC